MLRFALVSAGADHRTRVIDAKMGQFCSPGCERRSWSELWPEPDGSETPEPLPPYTLEALRAVASQTEYYIPLRLAPDDPLSVALKTLARKGYIHWCPYPEEFYIVRAPGVAELTRHEKK